MSKNLSLQRELSFRRPLPVTQVYVFRQDGAYPVCPRCGVSLEREFQNFCDRCGQMLDWKQFKYAQIIYPGCRAGHSRLSGSKIAQAEN